MLCWMRHHHGRDGLQGGANVFSMQPEIDPLARSRLRKLQGTPEDDDYCHMAQKVSAKQEKHSTVFTKLMITPKPYMRTCILEFPQGYTCIVY
jgi:hypothetical protein